MKPIWDKGKPVNELIQKYTVGRDREMDLLLAKYDVQGSLAHITMLQAIGLLEPDELKALSRSPTPAATGRPQGSAPRN